jgi:protein SPT2
MQKLVDKRKRKAENTRRSYYDEDDESLDDFIVDDDGDEEEGDHYGRGARSGGRRYKDEDEGYDRDEIWQMFNRGKRRADFVIEDEDDSDMEATGAELFREEQRSLRVAREEDEAEERELKRRAEEKKRRKLRQQ